MAHPLRAVDICCIANIMQIFERSMFDILEQNLGTLHTVKQSNHPAIYGVRWSSIGAENASSFFGQRH